MRRRVGLAAVGFLLIAAAEIIVSGLVADAIGVLWTAVLLLGCCLAGLLLLGREGARGWRNFRAAAEGGRPPGPQVTDGLVGLSGALLLAIPGFLTAAAGILLLLPPLRQVASRSIERSMARRVSSAAAGDLFGPRRVRVRRGAPLRQEPPAPTTATTPITGEVVEGEVVDGNTVGRP